MTTTPQPKLGEILVRAGVIDHYQLDAALAEQGNWGHRVGVTLVKLGFLDEKDLVRALAHQLELPIAGLEGKRIHPDVLGLVTHEAAQKSMMLPLFIRDENCGNVLYVAMDDPCDFEAVDEISITTGMRVKPVVVAPSELSEGIERFYRELAETSDGFMPLAPAAPEDEGPAQIEIPEASLEPVQEPLAPPMDPELPPSMTPEMSSAESMSALEATPMWAGAAPQHALFEPAPFEPEAQEPESFEPDAPAPESVDSESADSESLESPRDTAWAQPAAGLDEPVARTEMSEELAAEGVSDSVADLDESAEAPAERDALNRRVVRALAQLLVEKGVLDRTELQDRLAALESAELEAASRD